MFNFSDDTLYHAANGKTYGRVSSGTSTVVEPPTGEKATRDAQLAVCVITALSLVLATTSIVLNVVVSRESSVAQVGQQGAMRVCIPCYQVMGSKPKESDMESLERLFHFRRNRLNKGTESRVQEHDKEEGEEEEEDRMCCVDDANQLENLLNKILDEKEAAAEDDDGVKRTADEGPYPSCDLSSLGSSNGTACLLPSSLSLNPNAVAAHLVSLGSDAAAAPAEGLSMAKWNRNSRRSFCRRLDCNSTHILPSHPGHYFVYSQVSFSFRSASADEQLAHFIKRYNPRNPNGGVEIVMQHSSTVRGYTPSPSSSSTVSHPITDSSFLGGLVRVYPNDKFYVEVSHPQSLRPIQTATFFGMFKLP